MKAILRAVVILGAIALVSQANEPDREMVADWQNPTTIDLKNIGEGSTPLMRVYTERNGTNYFLSSDWGAFMWWGTNYNRSTSVVQVVCSGSLTNGYADFNWSNGDTGTNGSYWGGVTFTNATKSVTPLWINYEFVRDPGVKAGELVFINLPSGVTDGDLIYWNGSIWTVIPIGNTNNVLGVTNGMPAWISQTSIDVATTVESNRLAIANGLFPTQIVHETEIADLQTGTNAAFEVTTSAGVRVGLYTSFDSAIAACPDDGLTECIRLGQYDWTYSIIPSNGVTVIGHGGLTLNQTNRNQYLLFTSLTNTFTGIAFKSAFTNPTPTASMIANGGWLTFENCSFTNTVTNTMAALGVAGTSTLDLRDTTLNIASGNIVGNGTSTINDYGGSVWASATMGTTNYYGGAATLGGEDKAYYRNGANHTNLVLFSGPGSTGTVTSTSSDTNKFLQGDGSWATPAGAGDFLADGSVPMTGDLDYGGNSGTNLGAGSAATDAVQLQQAYNSANQTNWPAYVWTNGSPQVSANGVTQETQNARIGTNEDGIVSLDARLDTNDPIVALAVTSVVAGANVSVARTGAVVYVSSTGGGSGSSAHTYMIDTGDWGGDEVGAGSLGSGTNNVVWGGYSTWNATNSANAGDAWYCSSTTLNDKYYVGRFTFERDTSLALDSLWIGVRSSATSPLTNKVNIQIDDTVNTFVTNNLCSTTADVWNWYGPYQTSTDLPVSWTNTLPTWVNGTRTNFGLNVRADVFTSHSNNIQLKVEARINTP